MVVNLPVPGAPNRIKIGCRVNDSMYLNLFSTMLETELIDIIPNGLLFVGCLVQFNHMFKFQFNNNTTKNIGLNS